MCCCRPGRAQGAGAGGGQRSGGWPWRWWLAGVRAGAAAGAVREPAGCAGSPAACRPALQPLRGAGAGRGAPLALAAGPAGGAVGHARCSTSATSPACTAPTWSSTLRADRGDRGGGGSAVRRRPRCAVLGLGLLAAMALRLAWLRCALPRCAGDAGGARRAPLPAPPVWLWAVAGAGLPLALPFAARSLASQAGEGALATFNYAWKLVELPLVLAIQLVASLAFPAIARRAGAAAARRRPRRRARGFALAWALACAAAAALLVGAPALAQLLFGWGRMDAAALAQVARWGLAGAWGLLPQARHRGGADGAGGAAAACGRPCSAYGAGAGCCCWPARRPAWRDGAAADAAAQRAASAGGRRRAWPRSARGPARWLPWRADGLVARLAWPWLLAVRSRCRPARRDAAHAGAGLVAAAFGRGRWCWLLALVAQRRPARRPCAR